MHILHTVFYTIIQLVIISFILMTLLCDTGVLLLGEIRCLSLSGVKGLTHPRPAWQIQHSMKDFVWHPSYINFILKRFNVELLFQKPLNKHVLLDLMLFKNWIPVVWIETSYCSMKKTCFTIFEIFSGEKDRMSACEGLVLSTLS